MAQLSYFPFFLDGCSNEPLYSLDFMIKKRKKKKGEGAYKMRCVEIGCVDTSKMMLFDE